MAPAAPHVSTSLPPCSCRAPSLPQASPESSHALVGPFSTACQLMALQEGWQEGGPLPAPPRHVTGAVASSVRPPVTQGSWTTPPSFGLSPDREDETSTIPMTQEESG